MKNRVARMFVGALAVAVSTMVVTVTIGSGDVSATGRYSVNVNNSYIQRMLLTAAAECIRNREVVTNGDVSLNADSEGNIKLLKGMFNKNAKSTVPLPSYATKMKESEVSCYNLFTGDGWGTGGSGTFDGVMGMFGISSMSVREQLELFGFKPEGSNADSESMVVVFKNSGSGGSEARSNVINVSERGGGDFITVSSAEPTLECMVDGVYDGALTKTILNISKKGSSTYHVGFNQQFCQKSTNMVLTDNDREILTKGADFEYSGKSAEEFFEVLQSTVSRLLARNGNSVKYMGIDSSAGATFDVVWTMQDGAVNTSGNSNKWVRNASVTNYEVAKNVVSKMSGGKYTLDNLSFTPEEALDYYVAELAQHYFSGSPVSDYWICDGSYVADDSRFVAIDLMPVSGTKYKRPETGTTCVIRMTNANAENANDKINGFSSVSWERDANGNEIARLKFDVRNGDHSLDKNGLVTAINALVAIALQPGETTDISVASDATGMVDNADATCGNSGAAGALGWLICPLLEGIGEAVEGLYDNFIEPSLRIEPQLFGTSENSGTLQGWKIFQGIANVLLIVLFLVVIFSQLTGVGIDNYGIKKILPRLILVAILMNLSYYICVACVDISNIAGNSIQGLFDSLPANVNSGSINSSILAETGSTLVSVGVLSAAIGGAWLAGAFTTAALLALLPTAVSVIIAIFFLFVILAARQAAVVVMVVISPLAFACYALPNTKRLFDKWLKIGEALLLVYPICGLLVAGGDYVSRLLLSTGFGDGGMVSALTAILVGIVPIFFIPTVLKDSMNGLGNIGNKISGIGSRVGRGAASGVRNSEAYKNAMQAAGERRRLRMSGLKKTMKYNENTKQWEEHWGDDESSRGARWRRRIAESSLGRATGADRALGRLRDQVQADDAKAKQERQSMRADIQDAKLGKSDNELVARSEEATAGVARTTEAYEGQLARNALINREEEIRAGAAEVTRKYARSTAENKRDQQQGQYNADVARTNLGYETAMANYANAQQQAKIDAGAPELNGEVRKTLATMAGNEINMTNSRNRIGVAEVNQELANLRATASFKAQELKNAADMYSTFSSSKLMEAAGLSYGDDGEMRIDYNKVNEMISQKGGAQRASALFQAMVDKGLETNVHTILENPEVANTMAGNEEISTDIKTQLASSPDKVLRAFGKKSGNMTFEQFMTNENGIRAYSADKGSEFVRDITDKSLKTIEDYDRKGNHILNIEQLIDVLSTSKEKASIDSAVNMLGRRKKYTIPGAKLANVSSEALKTLSGSEDGEKAILKGSIDMDGNNDLLSKVSGESRKEIDKIRVKNGLQKLWPDD